MADTPPRFITRSEIAETLHLSISGIERLRRDPTAAFPQPIKLTPASNSKLLWARADFERWLSSRPLGV